MADEIDVNSINAAGDAYSRLQGLLTNVSALLKTASDSMSTLFTSTSRSINDTSSSISDVSQSLGGLIGQFKEASTGARFTDTIQDVNQLLETMPMLTKSLQGLGSALSNMKIFDQFSKDGVSAINTVSDSAKNLTGVFDALHIPVPEAIKNVAENFATNASQAEQLEAGYVGLAASVGQMNQLWEGSQGPLKNLSSLTTTFTGNIADSADATGMDIKATMEFVSQLKGIPNVLNSVTQMTGGATEKQNSLTAALQLMTGSGRAFSDVANAMTKGYEDLANSQGEVTNAVQKGQEFFATMSTISSTLGLNFDYVEKQLNAVADAFSNVGDNTAATANIFGRYTDALRQTGLTSKSTSDLIGTMVTGMEKMSMAEKAFLSARSGGPGGLQGAFKIEQMMREGRVDEVMRMAEQNIKRQFGGQIYTQQEAAQSPQAAAQFMRQRTMLQSGMFGIGKGTTDEQATRLLEALKNNNGNMVKEIATGQKAVGDVTKRGNDLQNRNNDDLKRISNATERAAIATEIFAGAFVKQQFGTTGASDRGFQIRNAMSSAASKAKENSGEIAQKREAIPDYMAQSQRFMNDAISRIIATTGATGGDIVGGIQENMPAMPQYNAEAGFRGGGAPRQQIQNAAAASMRGATHPAANPHAMANTAAQAMARGGTVRHEPVNVSGNVNVTIHAPDGFNITAQSDNRNVTVQTLNASRSAAAGSVITVPSGGSR